MSKLDEFLIDPTLEAIKRTPINISDALAQAIKTAEDRGVPMVFAYLDASESLRQTYRGSIRVHGTQQLAFWNRDPNGGFIKALKAGYDSVCTTYRDTDSPQIVQFHGKARLVEDEKETSRIWNESPELERKLTHGQNGVGVVIDLELIQGLEQEAESGQWKPFSMGLV